MCVFTFFFFFNVFSCYWGGKKTTLCLPLRRLGVELGKVQVYQEANRGKAMPVRA